MVGDHNAGGASRNRSVGGEVEFGVWGDAAGACQNDRTRKTTPTTHRLRSGYIAGGSPHAVLDGALDESSCPLTLLMSVDGFVSDAGTAEEDALSTTITPATAARAP